jgi:hypothetical protein
LGTIPAALYRAFVFPIPIGNAFSFQNLVYFLSNLFVLAIPLLTYRLFSALRFKRAGLWFMAVAVSGFLVLGFVVPQAGGLQRYKAPMVAFVLMGWLMSLERKQFDNKKM